MRVTATGLFLMAMLANTGAALAAQPGAAPSAASDDQPGARTESTADAASDPGHMTCRVTKTIGSNLSHKVCRSAAQMERERELSREGLSKAQQLH